MSRHCGFSSVFSEHFLHTVDELYQGEGRVCVRQVVDDWIVEGSGARNHRESQILDAWFVLNILLKLNIVHSKCELIVFDEVVDNLVDRRFGLVVAFFVEVFGLPLNVCDDFDEGLRVFVRELKLQLLFQRTHLSWVNFGEELTSARPVLVQILSHLDVIHCATSTDILLHDHKVLTLISHCLVGNIALV